MASSAMAKKPLSTNSAKTTTISAINMFAVCRSTNSARKQNLRRVGSRKNSLAPRRQPPMRAPRTVPRPEARS